MTNTPPPLELVPCVYEVVGHGLPHLKITVERRYHGHTVKWSACAGGCCITASGNDEWEPSASNQTAAFASRVRFGSPEEAMAGVPAYIRGRQQDFKEWQKRRDKHIASLHAAKQARP